MRAVLVGTDKINATRESWEVNCEGCALKKIRQWQKKPLHFPDSPSYQRGNWSLGFLTVREMGWGQGLTRTGAYVAVTARQRRLPTIADSPLGYAAEQ